MSPQVKLEKLKKIWDKKLADSGFHDIEQADGNLKIWMSHLFRVKYNEDLVKAKEDYYRLAGQFLHDHKFANKTERKVWELHSEGLGEREIALTLTGKKTTNKVSRMRVQKTVKNLRELMLGRTK